LEKLSAPSGSGMSLNQRQIIQGVLIAAGIMGGLILLAFALQYFQP